MEKELISLTKKLITFKTVTGNLVESRKCIDYIRDYLKGFPMKMYSYNSYGSLIVSNCPIPPNKRFDVILHGHIDVVASDNPQQFSPVVENGNIYGRGALDMKGGVACLMYLIRNNKNNQKKIALLITSDEEVGGNYGTEYVLKKLGYSASMFITAEGEKKYYLKTQQKGVFMFKLETQGVGDHSAYTWKNGNAILHLIDAYKKIESLFPHYPKDKRHWYTTVNMGVIRGGIMRNSIPDHAEAEFDIRFCGKYSSIQKVQSAIDKALKNNKAVTFKKLFSTEMTKTDVNNKHVKRLNSICRRILKKKEDLYFNNHGTNDARFASDVGIPAVGFGPVGDNYHAKDEYVSIESLRNFYEIVNEFVQTL